MQIHNIYCSMMLSIYSVTLPHTLILQEDGPSLVTGPVNLTRAVNK